MRASTDAPDTISAPSLVPAVDDLLKTTPRDLLRLIVETGDVVIGGDGEPWLVLPGTPEFINALAAFEADLADLEDSADAEPDVDDEPSLGSLNGGSQLRTWRADTGSPDCEGDGDGRDSDLEPLLGAPENHPSCYGSGVSTFGHQGGWANRCIGAVNEEELDPAELGIGDADGLAEQTQGEPSLGATTDVDQRVAWRKSYSDGWFSYDDREA